VESAQSEFRKKFRNSAEKRNSRLILAFDEPKAENVQTIIETVTEYLAAFKFHTEHLSMWGLDVPALRQKIDSLAGERMPFIVDAKLADIPKTNAMKAKYYFSQGYDAITCHGFPGQESVEAVVKVASKMRRGVFLIVAMSSEDHLFDSRVVERLARMAKELGVAGVIAPGNQYEVLRKVRRFIGPEMLILSPGIGVQNGEAGRALRAGADFAIIGRQIFEAENPEKIVIEIKERLNSCLVSAKRPRYGLRESRRKP